MTDLAGSDLERERLAALRSYAVLDTPPEQAFDELTEMAARICEAPISLITLVDEERQWFKSELGLGLKETSRSVSFCAHAITEPGLLIVPDATLDPRFADNPLVVQPPSIRFYAGSPLVSEDGFALGTLCVIDRQPREMKAAHEQALRILSRHVMALLELRRSKRQLDAVSERLASEVDLRVEADRLRSEIAEHGRIEERLRRERNLSEEIVNSLPGVFYLFNEQGRFLRWNRNLETVTGYSGEELKTLHPLQLFRGESREAVAQRITEVFGSGAAEVEAEFVAKDGATKPYFFNGWRILFDGQPCLIGMGIDVSERKQLEEQLLQVQKLESIGRLAAGIAHDFNNLLTVQDGYLSMLAADPAMPDTCREPIQQVLLATEQAAALTRQLLLFSRKQVMQFRTLDLNATVTSLAQILRRILGDDIRLDLALADDVARIEADPGMVSQVLMNLAVNSRDAMPDGGRFRIATATVLLDELAAARHQEARVGRFVLLEVSDTGVGMPHEIAERAFEPFYTTKDVGQGTGLGLSTVHGIVKQHQGWIELSTVEQGGTTFRIYIPAVIGGEPSQSEGSADAEAPARTETVLLVDDDLQVREMVRTALEWHGYTVLVAEDGVDAMRVWRDNAERVDLLMTDMVMPKQVTGVDLMHKLREENPNLKVIISSGYGSDKVNRELRQAGTTLYLQKPYRIAELLQTLRELLDRRQDDHAGSVQ